LDEKTLKSKYISKIDKGYILIIKNGKEIKKIKSSDSFEIIDYTSNDKKELYVLSNIDRDKIGLFKTDTNANIISNCLFESKIVDIQNIIQNYKTKKLEKAIYMQEKHEIHYFDKKLEKEMKIVKNKLIEKFPNEKKSIISCSYVLGSNKELILIDTYSDKKPIDEYLFDVKKNEIIKLTENYK
jgi:predicted P-loop ATPase/GTPase